ncbi:molybdopterin-guanine dinucleotide biosynthesis protein B [Sulfurospirillum sp. 1612]|uniref:molybdopterin-guanine dinucleotide biosynthesis protein B n=1 Tax=Sulfurospirillum sp. 1612 TaxID=3094835 RepID=UPI002F93182F
MKYLAIAFSGPSDSGKTSLIVKVSNQLQKKYEIAIVKHDPSDKATFDQEGKDSWKFAQTGAEVLVVSETRTTFFSQRRKDLDEIIRTIGEFDLLMVEGLKTLPLPRISIFRNKIDESYFKYSNAIAIDDSINVNDYNIPEDITVLDLNDTDAIIDWVIKNAKKVK